MNIGERLLGAVINPVVGAVDVDRVVDDVDIDAVLQRVDIDELLARVDINALLQRIDIQALLARIDIDALAARVDVQAVIDRVDLQSIVDRVDLDSTLARVDVDAVIDRVDVQTVIDRVDVQGLVDRVDLDSTLARVDVDAVIDRVDVAAVASRAGIDDIVADATRGVSTKLLALARRQIVALDLIMNGLWAKVARRARPEPPPGHSATGLVAGPVSRLLAYFVDFAVLSIGFAALTAVITFLVTLFSGDNVDSSHEGTAWAFGFSAGYLVFAFLYWVIGLSIAGSSIGKALVGVRVVRLDGTSITGRQAIVRVLVYPFSFILGLGLIPIVTAKSHRALHDKAAHTSVRYDWGDDTSTARAPLTAWLRSKGPGHWEIDDSPPQGGIGTSSAQVDSNGANDTPLRVPAEH